MHSFIVIAFCITIIQGSFIKENTASTSDCSDIIYKRPEVFSVRGTSTLSLEPTIAKIDYTIAARNILASPALADANSIQSSAQKSLKSVDTSNAGIKITTTSFSLFPDKEWQYNEQTQKHDIIFDGYKVSIDQQIETENLKIVGPLIDAAIKAGVTQINNISFDIKPEQKAQLRDQMIQLAIKDATHKAQIALKGLNMKIHSIKFVSLEDSYAPRPMMYAKSNENMAMDAMAGAAPTQIYAQEQNISHSVTVGFIIVPIDE